MEKIKNISNDPQILIYEVRKRRKDFIFWVVVIFLIIIFLVVCNNETSILKTLSSLLKTFSFSIILIKALNNQNFSGISINSLICYFISFLCHNFVVFFFSLRLRNFEVDIVNSTLNQLSDFVSFFIICNLLYYIYFKYPETSDIKLDNKMPFYYLCIGTFLISIPFKPWVFRYWFIDLIWIYSLFLETISLFPQILLFSIKKGHIESFTSNYLVLQGVSSVFGLIFWYKAFLVFNDRSSLLLTFR